jgi:hypothetical protein
MRYSVHGPFEVPRSGNIVSRQRIDRDGFWGRVEGVEECLRGACGCYVLSIRSRAWYVGMAEKQSFRQECFSPHKIVQYDAALNEVQGIPYLLFLARLTPTGQFSSPSQNGHRDIRLLEKLLIGSALARNPDLRNVKDTMLLREMNVPGVLNSERGQARADAVQALRAALGI